ncbi:ubiquitin activating enzyme, putative [Trichomonas vaginalis G3]|uniref:Ubiquitin activating enzyme, putative n=1 Tax=Trichomonas vaginalis (strain ATCC PRA-98 / G3) TaxID=412133 RepID=A2EP39_TRIV3|nr:ubiquitin-activating enzyme E1 family [Trichomonas vaginalis G3]EAY05577.1 ubiquitin activating enzyme, putative [Trichomonas vaginalis G3]KAI5547519.1 ubiquitin-activating enzyme E1 family [Trichomonas vaginalis G3]|eukprot:XP_001317800.1 ubiquitin activating enzyme [Trichomonas vaginalis G3]
MTEIKEEDLYSRQIYAIGSKAMEKLTKSSVLISGMGAVGVEIAKNVILAGVKNVTIHDTRLTTLDDLAANFYLNDSNIGTNRAIACSKLLMKLNRYVSLAVNTDALTNELILQNQCFVLTDWHSSKEISEYSAFCHKNGIKFLFADVRGLFSFIFADNGKDFLIRKQDDTEPIRFDVAHISNDPQGIVTTSNPHGHGLETSGHIKFAGVEGMTEVNNQTFKYKKVKNDKYRIVIGDTTKFGKFVNNNNTAVAIEVKAAKKESYKDWTAVMKNPKGLFYEFDFSKLESHAQTLLFFLSYYNIITDSPAVDFPALLESAKQINENTKLVDSIDEVLLRNFANTTLSIISPMSSIVGGITGQEVMKSLTGQFTPIKQIVTLSYTDAIPDINNVDFAPKNDRYDAYRRIFGNKQQEIMSDLNYFLIGAGALGCELLKNWAMMGVATSEKGKITVTDMDQIAVSNLSRQFLFHEEDVGKMKSEIATKSAKEFNPSIKIEHHINRLDETTAADVYNEEFYKTLSGVCNALDNIPTRQFSDQLCVQRLTSLLESGTQGTKCNFEVYIPHKTQSYSSIGNYEGGGVPMCTIHEFPTNISHTITWSLDLFGNMFESDPETVNSFLKDKDYVKHMKEEDIGHVKTAIEIVEKMLINNKPNDYKDCVLLMRNVYQKSFIDLIHEVLKKNPVDSVDDQGRKFWLSEGRRLPHPLDFDENDELTKEFIKYGARLISEVYDIKVTDEDPMEILRNNDFQRFSQKENSDANKEINNDIHSNLRETCKPLKSFSFEKDDPSNGHVDFIYATANLRAKCYGIITENKMEVKRIAGNIVPALATTTSLVCGFVCMEMYKLHSHIPKDISEFRWGAVNLSNNFISLFEPGLATTEIVQTTGEKFNFWDKWTFDDLPVSDIMKALESSTKGTISMLTIGDIIVYADFNERDEVKLGKKVSEVLKELNIPLKPGTLYIKAKVLINDENNNSINHPPVYFKVN